MAADQHWESLRVAPAWHTAATEPRLPPSRAPKSEIALMGVRRDALAPWLLVVEILYAPFMVAASHCRDCHDHRGV